MAQDLEQLLREILGDSFGKLAQFQSDQMSRIQSKVNELARAALKDDLTRMAGEIADLRRRVAELEAERVQTAADTIAPNF